jgi:aspartate 1-decarboxylase
MSTRLQPVQVPRSTAPPSPTPTSSTRASVTISGELMDAAGILPFEQVHVWNVARGTRLVTYALRGEDDSGIICINGAAAHLAGPGDKVIIATFTEVDAAEAATWGAGRDLRRRRNRQVGAGAEIAGPKRRVNALA